MCVFICVSLVHVAESKPVRNRGGLWSNRYVRPDWPGHTRMQCSGYRAQALVGHVGLSTPTHCPVAHVKGPRRNRREKINLFYVCFKLNINKKKAIWSFFALHLVLQIRFLAFDFSCIRIFLSESPAFSFFKQPFAWLRNLLCDAVHPWQYRTENLRGTLTYRPRHWSAQFSCLLFWFFDA